MVENQVIEFEPNLTILYGVNGSGKSGYVRLLNNVFVSKGDKTIVPNIYSDNPKNAKAEFVFKSAEAEYLLSYPLNKDNPEFKQFSVFDTRCVPVHLNNKNQFEFRPAGLSFFGDLTECYKRIEDILHKDIDKCNTPKDYLSLFEGDSEIKLLIQLLGPKTKVEALKAYLPYSDEDKVTKKELEEKKAELMSLKKDKEISDLTDKKNSIVRLRQAIETINKYFSVEQLDKTKSAIENYKTKQDEIKRKGIDSFKSSKIANIGSDAWKAFIEAADVFARQQSDNEFNYPNTDSLCLFCQQPLGEEAKNLILSYWQFIRSKMEEEFKELENAIVKDKLSFEKLIVDILPEDNVLKIWLVEHYPQIVTPLIEDLNLLKKTHKEIIEALVKKESFDCKGMQIDTSILDTINQSIDVKIKALQNNESNIELETINSKLVYLAHKEKLSTHISSIEAYVNSLKWAEIAGKSKSKIPKTRTTNKEKELSAKYFNQAYIDLFKRECQKLDGDFDIDITHTGSGGISYRQLFIRGKQPSQILSEGEQKVISLADFLAETQLSSINKGIIFDDPVTSLDNTRKKRIAERLVEEARHRQVIIFTHDIVFISALLEDIDADSLKHSCHLIEKNDKVTGYIYLKNGPSHISQYKNSKVPKEYLAQAGKANCPPQERDFLIKNAFTYLRTCYEYLVTYNLFNGVIKRFDERMSIDNLRKVVVEETVAKDIVEAYHLCCRYMEGHLHSDDFASMNKPGVNELKAELDRYDNIKKKISK